MRGREKQLILSMSSDSYDKYAQKYLRYYAFASNYTLHMQKLLEYFI